MPKPPSLVSPVPKGSPDFLEVTMECGASSRSMASPASALAHHIGQILLVVRADRTSENDLSEAVKLLAGQAPIQLLLNGMTFPGSSQKYGSYYGYGG